MTSNIIELKDCSKEYSGNLALDSVSLAFAEHGLCLILGGNAAGKSTLLKSIAGLVIASFGEIKASLPTAYYGHESGLYPQLSIKENFELLESLDVVDSSLLAEALENFELKVIFAKKINELSQGQKARVNLARVFSSPASWPILLDEPASNLDSKWRVRLKELICLGSSSRQILMVTHDPESYFEIADRLIFMNSGKVVSDKLKQQTSVDQLHALYSEYLR